MILVGGSDVAGDGIGCVMDVGSRSEGQSWAQPRLLILSTGDSAQNGNTTAGPEGQMTVFGGRTYRS